MLPAFDPLVSDWFATRFGEPTEPQLRGWPEIRAGHDVLISAPTGSGKTLAAFLLFLDRLVRQARSGELPNETELVYVSPLKDAREKVEEADLVARGLLGSYRRALGWRGIKASEVDRDLSHRLPEPDGTPWER